MDLRQKLEKLLEGTIPDLSERKQVWIWGAGNTAELYQEGLKRLGEKEFKIAGYIDRKAEVMGNCFHEKIIKTPDQIMNMDKEKICVLICSTGFDVIASVRNICRKHGLENYLLDEVVLKYHKEEVLKCYDLFCDDRSRQVYYQLTKVCVTGSEEGLQEICDLNQYFSLSKFVEPDENQIFIDCGSYDGDTICDYLRFRQDQFKKVIGFEMDLKNYQKLQENVYKMCDKEGILPDKFELYSYAVGDRECISRMERYENNDGLSSKISENGDECKMVDLDHFLKEPYHFLKADIESYEYKMLCGAEDGIKRNKPLLAICIYHNAVDFYSIPLLIKEMVPEYNIAVRHHHKDNSETVVYAWV